MPVRKLVLTLKHVLSWSWLFTFMPCPSIGPKLFWTDQIIWKVQNHFGSIEGQGNSVF